MRTSAKQIRSLFSGAALALTLTGCETLPEPTVLPMAGGQFKVIATGYDEQSAIKYALASADARCDATGQEAYVLTSSSTYQGIDRNTAAIIDLVSTAASAAGYPSHVTTHDKNDYKATLVAQCGRVQPAG